MSYAPPLRRERPQYDDPYPPSKRIKLSTRDLEETSVASGRPKLIISNLCDRVQPHHLTRLFSDVGPIAKITLQFDSQGNRTGAAEVTMENREHALEVVKNFNGASLDGFPMEIVLVEEKPKPPPAPVSYERRREPSPRYEAPSYHHHPHYEEEPLPPRRSEPEVVRRPAPMRVVSKSFVPKDNFVIQVDNSGNGEKDHPRRGEGRGRPFKERRGRGGRGGRGRGSRGQSRGGRGGSEKRGPRREDKTQAQLDAELNAYFGSGSEKKTEE